MKIKNLTISVFFIILSLTQNIPAIANELKTFQLDSYQQILNANKNKPFILIIWSISCSSCLKEMPLISQLHQQYPEVKFVMVSVDDMSVSEQINEILHKHELQILENWVFEEDNSAKLRFKIDPQWYGELPRTYFFDAAHQHEGVSGLISEETFLEKIENIGYLLK